jgi:transglutaminase-like putative cysteine protease
MEEFVVEYLIENKYELPVRKANFQLLVIPESNSGQKVTDLKVWCTENQELYVSKNIFGFNVITYYFSKPFTEFWFRLTARVQKEEFNPFKFSNLLPNDEFEILNSSDFQIENSLFLTETELTRMPRTHNYTFPVYSGEIYIFDYLIELKRFIFQYFEYSPQSTDVKTPIEEVLKIGKGVCQDFAHVFISVCRQNKIPARYVSGYLNQGMDFKGASQLHAWAEAFIPELGWVGFDSTNNLLADMHYIKIAHGTDYRDCSPIIGVLETTGTQISTHSVTVINQ